MSNLVRFAANNDWFIICLCGHGDHGSTFGFGFGFGLGLGFGIGIGIGFGFGIGLGLGLPVFASRVPLNINAVAPRRTYSPGLRVKGYDKTGRDTSERQKTTTKQPRNDHKT
jgi:hypothetical protein